MDEKEQFAQMVKQSRRIVAFTGAGMSTESGVPDFRSAGGLFDALSGNYFWAKKRSASVSCGDIRGSSSRIMPSILISQKRNPMPDTVFLPTWRSWGKEVTVVTQNIDNLHQSAGSTNVIELHGNGTKWRRLDERERVDEALIRMDKDGMQRDDDGEMVRPDIVLYGEALDEDAMQNAMAAIRNADMLVVIGTSLNVYPAAAFIDYFEGPFAVLINRTTVPAMERFQLAIQTTPLPFWQTFGKPISACKESGSVILRRFRQKAATKEKLP